MTIAAGRRLRTDGAKLHASYDHNSNIPHSASSSHSSIPLSRSLISRQELSDFKPRSTSSDLSSASGDHQSNAYSRIPDARNAAVNPKSSGASSHSPEFCLEPANVKDDQVFTAEDELQLLPSSQCYATTLRTPPSHPFDDMSERLEQSSQFSRPNKRLRKVRSRRTTTVKIVRLPPIRKDGRTLRMSSRPMKRKHSPRKHREWEPRPSPLRHTRVSAAQCNESSYNSNLSSSPSAPTSISTALNHDSNRSVVDSPSRVSSNSRIKPDSPPITTDHNDSFSGFDDLPRYRVVSPCFDLANHVGSLAEYSPPPFTIHNDVSPVAYITTPEHCQIDEADETISQSELTKFRAEKRQALQSRLAELNEQASAGARSCPKFISDVVDTRDPFADPPKGGYNSNGVEVTGRDPLLQKSLSIGSSCSSIRSYKYEILFRQGKRNMLRQCSESVPASNALRQTGVRRFLSLTETAMRSQRSCSTTNTPRKCSTEISEEEKKHSLDTSKSQGRISRRGLGKLRDLFQLRKSEKQSMTRDDSSVEADLVEDASARTSNRHKTSRVMLSASKIPRPKKHAPVTIGEFSNVLLPVVGEKTQKRYSLHKRFIPSRLQKS